MEELLALARNEGYELSEPADRSTLIETILETLEEQRRERQEENNPNVRVEETKFEVSSDDELALASELHADTDLERIARRLLDGAWSSTL